MLVSVWEKELLKQNPNFFICLCKTYKKEYAVILFHLTVSMVCVLAQSVLIGEFIAYTFESFETTKSVLISIGITIIALIGIIANEKLFLYSGELAIKIRVNCNKMIFEKVLKGRLAEFDEKRLSSVISLLNIDIPCIMQLCMTTFVVLIPFYFIAATVLLYLKIGISGVFTHILMILNIPILSLLLRKLDNYKEKIRFFSEERIKIVNEIIEGIKTFKIFRWEKHIETKLIKARNSEILWHLKKSIYKIISFTIVTSFQGAFIFFGYWVKVKLDGRLDLDQDFSGVCILLTSHFYITACVSEGLNTLQLIKITSKKIQETLLLPEIQNSNLTESQNLVIKGLFSCWSLKEFTEKSFDYLLSVNAEFCLKDLSLLLSPGEMIGLTGPVASGKSSVLLSILNELIIFDGEIKRPSKVSYYSQEPWVIKGSIRSNILMGEEIDEKKYWNIIEICELKEDINNMVDADFTNAGEEGKLLSQGQKARVALARTLYRDAELYLIDDPFASLDSKIADIIMKKVFTDYLSKKTRIIVFKDLNFLNQFDKIVALKDGYLEFCGSFSELMMDSNSKNLLINHSKFERNQKIKAKFLNKLKYKRKSTVVAAAQITSETLTGMSYLYFNFSLFFKFLLYSFKSWWFMIFFVLVSSLLQFFYIYHQYLTSLWSVDSEAQLKQSYYTYYLLIITCIIISGTLLRNALLYFLIYISSKILHNRTIKSILNTHISFFYTKTVKDLTDSLSADIFQIDENLTQSITFTAMFGIMILSYIIYIIYVVPINLVNIFIFISYSFFLIYYFTQPIVRLRTVYIQSSAPLISICKDCISGLATIHSLSLSSHFSREFKSKNLALVKSFLNFFYSLRCYTTLISVGASFLLSFNLFFLIFYLKGANPSLMAVSLSFNIGIMNMLPWFFRLIIDIVILLPSVQRVEAFHSLPAEEPKDLPDLSIKKGKIQFEAVTVVYPSYVEMALSDVSFEIKPGKKFGIIGRSGSGKSSILNVFYRFITPISGRVLVDGQDINKCSIQSLRKQVSFMSQTPFIFTGSLKENIDPDGSFSDEGIIAVLKLVGLHDISMIYGLDNKIPTLDLSTGQKQLLALCRVLIRNTKILILDEATANIDNNSERQINNLISNHFEGRTVLCIAHKLKLLTHYDLVMIIDNGYVCEILPPREILTRDPTLFSFIK